MAPREPTTPPRERDHPGRSRAPRKLLDDVRAGPSDVAAGVEVGPPGTVPTAAPPLVSDADRPEAKLYSCQTCPATHSAEMMIAVRELSGPGIDNLPASVAYICCWCDQHGRRVGKIDRDVP